MALNGSTPRTPTANRRATCAADSTTPAAWVASSSNSETMAAATTIAIAILPSR